LVGNYSLGVCNPSCCLLHSSVVEEHSPLGREEASKDRRCKKLKKGDERMGIVLTLAGTIGFALLIYLFYVLFRGDKS